MLDRSLLTACLAAFLTAYLSPAYAVALRPGKVTDATVCDLAPNTIGFLGGSLLIPAAAAKRDQVDAYFRLSASFVAQKCADGQILILQGMSDLAVAAESLVQLANSACAVATVVRSEVSIPFLGGSEPGFELRCPITKRNALGAHLGELEPDDAAVVRLTLGAGALLHRVSDGGWRLDGPQLHAVDLDAPLAGGLVEDGPEALVDLLAGREGGLEVHAADDVAQRRHGELLDGLDVVLGLVGRANGIDHLEVDDRVDAHHQVVLGDHALRREGHNHLAHIHGVADQVDEGHQQVEAGGEGALVAAEALDDAPAKSKACTDAGKEEISILGYDTQDEATAAVTLGRADALSADSPVTQYAVAQSKGKLQIAGDVYDIFLYGMPVPQGSAMGTALQAALIELQADGTYSEILSKWGVEGGAITDITINGAQS